MEILIVIGLAAFGIWMAISKAKSEEEEKLQLRRQLSEEIQRRNEVESKKAEIERKEKNVLELIEKEKTSRDNFQNKFLDAINTNLANKTTGFKWVASLVSDISVIAESEYIKQLNKSFSYEKKERALKITDLKDEKRKLIEENKILKYEIEYVKAVIPQADDLFEYDDIGIIYRDYEKYSNYLTKEEYNTLSDTEKSKRALDYYKRRKKTNWEIGRDFERYVGYQYELMGYEVDYYGMEMKLEDLGRDLIAFKDNEVIIIQCKYWSKNKVIHEKHIAQLFGTTKSYEIEHPEIYKISSVFITHTQLSEQAKIFCRSLNVTFIENMELGEYPLIKCHVNKDVYGLETRIFHLPLDQQFDKTKINSKKGDFWATTIEEAESRGFRRAYKWHPYDI